MKQKKDEETATAKMEKMIKDTERIGSPGGSRQDKIFKNMRSSEIFNSPSASKLFCNLKNDGEKVSPKMDKAITDDVEELRPESPVDENDLPMLEWSSANPPSLTASPSMSILKNETMTPNKVFLLFPFQ